MIPAPTDTSNMFLGWICLAAEEIFEDLADRKGLQHPLDTADYNYEGLHAALCQLINDGHNDLVVAQAIIHQFCFDVPGFDKEWDQVEDGIRDEIFLEISRTIREYRQAHEQASANVIEAAEPPKKTLEDVKTATDVSTAADAVAESILNAGFNKPTSVHQDLRRAFLQGVNWQAEKVLNSANVKDFSQEQLQALAVEHPYYFIPTGCEYYDRFRNATAFLRGAMECDINRQLCIRWDVRKQREDGYPSHDGYTATLIFVNQRENALYAVEIERVYEHEVAPLREFLALHWQRNVENWKPISEMAEQELTLFYPAGNLRDAVEPILKVVLDHGGVVSPQSIKQVREHLIREVQGMSTPLLSAVEIVKWYRQNYPDTQVPKALHDVALEALRHYQQRQTADDPRTNDSVHTEREKFITRVADKIDYTVEELVARHSSGDIPVADIIRIGYEAANGAASRVLDIIDGTQDDPVLEDHPGYFLIPKDLGIINGPDISGHLCDLLFESINT